MDRISQLSDDLLLKILSSLPTKDVVATMFLSKRWKFLWTMVPKLDFDDGYSDRHTLGYSYDEDDYTRFQKYVDKFMVFYNSPVLESLKFNLGWCSSSDDMTIWIRIAIARRVYELEIYRSYGAYDNGEFRLPSCLYTYEKLVVLKLHKSILVDVPMEVCLSSLKTLHLLCVEFTNEESSRRLLSGCPVLEEFVLDKTENISPPCFCVAVPSLQRLSILDRCKEENDSVVEVLINAPSLKYLNIIDTSDSCLSFLSENMPEMVEANVNVVYKSPEKLMGSLSSAKRLSLCLSTTMLQHRIEYYQLVHLELCPCVKKWWDLLTWILESSPKLQVLKLITCKAHIFDKLEPIKGRWGQPSSVPECLLFHLNTFDWKYYNGRRKEKTMVAYILRNARRLKTADIFAWIEGPHELKELASLPRASKSCQLVLQ